jgi:hypothetical protein
MRYALLLVLLLVPFASAFKPAMRLPCELKCSQTVNSTCPETTHTTEQLRACISSANLPPEYSSCFAQCQSAQQNEDTKNIFQIVAWLLVSIGCAVAGYFLRKHWYGKLLIAVGVAIFLAPFLYLFSVY